MQEPVKQGGGLNNMEETKRGGRDIVINPAVRQPCRSNPPDDGQGHREIRKKKHVLHIHGPRNTRNYD